MHIIYFIYKMYDVGTITAKSHTVSYAWYMNVVHFIYFHFTSMWKNFPRKTVIHVQ